MLNAPGWVDVEALCAAIDAAEDGDRTQLRRRSTGGAWQTGRLAQSLFHDGSAQVYGEVDPGEVAALLRVERSA